MTNPTPTSALSTVADIAGSATDRHLDHQTDASEIGASTCASGDAAPGTIPSWAIKVAYDGEEWLVLVDSCAVPHECDSDWRQEPKFAVQRTLGFAEAEHGWCGCHLVLLTGVPNIAWEGDSLAEAHAAFDRLEQEWIARERPMSRCINERHYPQPEPPNALTADPRLHWADETPCVFEQHEGAGH